MKRGMTAYCNLMQLNQGRVVLPAAQEPAMDSPQNVQETALFDRAKVTDCVVFGPPLHASDPVAHGSS